MCEDDSIILKNIIENGTLKNAQFIATGIIKSMKVILFLGLMEI